LIGGLRREKKRKRKDNAEYAEKRKEKPKTQVKNRTWGTRSTEEE